MSWQHCDARENPQWMFNFPPLYFRLDFCLFDFENTPDLENWSDVSDSHVWPSGMSWADIDIYMSGTEPAGHFDSWLKPQPNGSCFCGVRTNVTYNLDGYEYIDFECLAKGNATTYKIVLGYSDSKHPNATLEQIFKVCPAKDKYFIRHVPTLYQIKN